MTKDIREAFFVMLVLISIVLVLYGNYVAGNERREIRVIERKVKGAIDRAVKEYEMQEEAYESRKAIITDNGEGEMRIRAPWVLE